MNKYQVDATFTLSSDVVHNGLPLVRSKILSRILNGYDEEAHMFIVGLGAIFFGITIGWITYRILRFRVGAPGLSDLIALLGAIGGAAVLVFRSDVLFGWYSIGLVIGFFAYFAVGLRLFGKQEVQPWRVEQIPPTSTPDTQPDTHED